MDMRVLALDASTHTGWALLDGVCASGIQPTILSTGIIENDKPVLGFGPYPYCYLHAAQSIATRLFELVRGLAPDVIVIEETNLARSRYSQKLLEFIHVLLLVLLLGTGRTPVYIDSGEWRRCSGAVMNKDEKKNNGKAGKAKKLAQALMAKDPALTPGKAAAQAKAALGIRGRITKKHVAIRLVNEIYGLGLKPKDNDRADAICLGLAYFNNAVPCDGI